MSKINARELKDARVDFVSFVEEGANGEGFKIFKSAHHKNNNLTDEEEGLFKKFINSLKEYITKKEKETTNMSDMQSILNEIKGVGDKIDNVNNTIETMKTDINDLKKWKEEVLNDKETGAGQENKDTGKEAGSGDGSENQNTDGHEKTNESNSDTKEILNQLTLLNGRIDNIENYRPSSKQEKEAISGDIKNKPDSVFNGFFTGSVN